MSVQNIMTSVAQPGIPLVPTMDRDSAKIVEFPRQTTRREEARGSSRNAAFKSVRDAVALPRPIEEVLFSVIVIAALAGVTLLLL
jgi:hypothetical protein